ncbi:MAG: SAM-dependent methyltransferase [Defluviitaleaceae bacterium]|nr:SAM-dependent methyltransferase [Defluviitaleaceae bacterium]
MAIYPKCQVFTPDAIAKQLLDIIGYEKNIYGKMIAENSCGAGNILVEIVRRYICDALNQNIAVAMIKAGLERDIYGAEIDKTHINNCLLRLTETAQEFGIENVAWNLYNGDFLKKDIKDEFHFVVGNPPYVAYPEIDLEGRSYLRKNFITCSHGKFDMCYAFIEASIASLKKDGKMAYLIPSNIFKNRFADTLRNKLLFGLTDIYDFTILKLFKNKLTASAIIIYNAEEHSETIKYHDIANKTITKIPKQSLESKWKFQSISESHNNICFGDIFHTASSIATLLNEVYIIGKFDDSGEFIHVEKFKIEKKLLRVAISPRSMKHGKMEYVIFPYFYENGKLMRYSNEEFKDKYPFGMSYLEQHKEKLSKRDSDKNSAWFEYGRSQALSHLNQDKLLISTVITNEIKTYILTRDEIPTSGLYITPKAEYGLDVAKRILHTNEFLNYVKNIGVVANGKSYRISPKDINNFTFESRWLL